MNDQLLKTLKELKENEFEFNIIEDKTNLTYELLACIGDEDAYIRDELIYPALARLLYRDHLPESVLLDILRILFSKSHLLYGLGTKDNNVFTRTFSSLQIAVLLYKHNQKNFIPKDDLIVYFRQFCYYYQNEVDLRGFLEKEGWAHSIAHAADVFKQFAQSEELNEEHYQEMLGLVFDKFVQSDYLYINNEDERTVSALELLLQRNVVSDDFVSEWIMSFSKYEKLEDYKKEYIINTNVKNLLRSLYFRIESFKEELEEVLYLINPFKK